MDALVAAIVRESGGRLATRDTNDFAGLGLDLVDP
jgi:predicted nucleic acid-binding protein